MISITFINNVVLQKLWNPFYELLENLKQFQVEKDKSIPEIKTKIQEFLELQDAANTLIDHRFDAKNNRLLIAGKSEPKGDRSKGERAVFAFDLNTKTLSEKAVYEFSEANIKQFLMDNNKIASDKGEVPKVSINPSGIAVHPITDKLYVLSSKDNLIYIFNRNSEVEAVYQLDKKMFLQAEGITFLDNGDMLISNEGRNEEPTLLRFNYAE